MSEVESASLSVSSSLSVLAIAVASLCASCSHHLW